MGPFRVLYIDMNSFFASVEQELDSSLRGRPVGITAMEGEKGCIVAASYEAKAHGVKTGCSIREARALCPRIQFRASRHRTYVRFNLRIAEILDRHAELMRIRSVDEFQLALSGEATTLDGARDLVMTLKSAVAREVGECIRFSAGIGPNHLLAKIAGKLEKPNGFQYLSSDNLPDRIAHLSLDDLPGISRSMLGRLHQAGVHDIPALYRLDPRHARLIWRSVEGERFVRALQGMDVPLQETQRGGYGNSKVLAPQFRRAGEAYLVSRWLIEKSASRLRRDGRVAASLSVSLSPLGQPRWGRSVKIASSQDTAEFLRVNRAIWRTAWPQIRREQLMSIGVFLGDVDYLARRNGDLLMPLSPSERTTGERASAVVDMINARFGRETIKWGCNIPHPGFFERG